MHQSSGPKPTARQPWDWREEGKQFHKAHGYTPYVMFWVKTLEAEMRDESLPNELRVLAAIRRYAWGNFSDFAVTEKPKRKESDPTPRPLTQLQLSDIVGIQPSHLSENIQFLKSQGYLRENHRFLFPEELESPFESAKDSNGNRSQIPTPSNFDSPYLRFEQEYLEKNPPFKRTLSEIEQRRKQYQEAARIATIEMRKMKLKVLAAWREKQRQSKEPAA